MIVSFGPLHPGELDLKDDIETAGQLFNLVNFIAYSMITKSKEIEEIYNRIPQEKRDAIEKRDAPARNQN